MMAVKLCFCLFVFCFVLSFSQANGARKKDQVYIVYMGDNPNNNHDILVNALLTRNKNALVHNYKNGFFGFAARITDSDAIEMAKQPGVVSVFPDPILQLHTTRSWDFLNYGSSALINSHPPTVSSQGSDTIIGILDTGIWPESESFIDRDMEPIPTRWRGKCMEGPDFSSSNCSKKLIGARFYKDEGSENIIQSPRDGVGHGTHTSSTAAGVSVANASFYGLANGVARGGSPTSRLAMYRVCYSIGCPGSAILAAFDDAIADGVDLLSLSLGGNSISARHFLNDTIAIGAFHAVQKGITVVCSAGNAGPYPQSVVNVAPWILTVAATTIDRDFESDIILGNNKVIKGESINFSELGDKPTIPLISGICDRNSKKNKGKLVLCQHIEDTDFIAISMINDIKEGGAVGLIIISDRIRLVGSDSPSFPVIVITSKDATKIYAYINSTENPVATITATKTISNFKPAPTVAYFSARGPSRSTKNLLKPDIAAPGVNILAAWMGNDTSSETTPEGREPPLFNIISGTSMSCPHVTGVAATIKSQNPAWSPAAIRSAIMTTATQTDNLKAPITTQSGHKATPYDLGAGELNPTAGLQPGLVYDIDRLDYLQFLCYYGYNISTIKLISALLPPGFSCPENSSTSMISNLNYPSIAITINSTTTPVTVKRTVTNVDIDEETIYTVIVDRPAGVEVTVTPNELKFTANKKKLDYQVTFSTTTNIGGDVFGAITWTNNKYKVRIPVVVCTK